MNITVKPLLTLAVSCLLLVSCTNHVQLINAEYPIRNKLSATAAGKHHFFFFGIGQSKVIDAAGICGGTENVLQVETQRTAADSVLALITSGIYTPLEYRVYCKPPIQ